MLVRLILHTVCPPSFIGLISFRQLKKGGALTCTLDIPKTLKKIPQRPQGILHIAPNTHQIQDAIDLPQ